jgi:hypothetical protein
MEDSQSQFASPNYAQNPTQQSVLNNFDFTAIDELDPSLGKLSFPFSRCYAYS